MTELIVVDNPKGRRHFPAIFVFQLLLGVTKRPNGHLNTELGVLGVKMKPQQTLVSGDNK
ncbi:MAG: hypothetical protein ACRBHB_04690 [Arenicella sp.]